MDPPATKLRIMCSYGGHIVPRPPRAKSLCYAGGDTRIVSINPLTTNSLSSFVSHLSSSLSIPAPFCLKYQLPNHDLDSLISLLTDDDLLLMLDELQRLSSSSSSRIRLFVLSAKAEAKSPQSVIQHPKTEAWFVDALKNAKIMQKGRDCLLGFEGEGAQTEDLIGNGIGSSMAESMVLETSSSFGSTSSSASLTNLAPIKSNAEEGMSGVQDSTVKFTSSDAIASESGVLSATSCPQTGAYQDPANAVLAASTDRVSYNLGELDSSKGSDVSSGIQVHNTVKISPFPLDRMQQQKVQYVQLDLPYIAQNPPGQMPISSFYPLYHTQMPHQQLMQFQYQSNQPPSVYLVPVAPAQAYNVPGYPVFIENHAMTSTQAPVHLNPSYIPPQQVVQHEPTQTDASLNLASHFYNAAHSTTQLVAPAPLLPVPYNEHHQQSLSLLETQCQPQTVGIPSGESSKPSNELDDDPAHVQIYKSQPPPPSCPLQYQTMNEDAAVLLSEALDQLHIDSLKQQIRTSQTQ